jgi:hypothetical protein
MILRGDERSAATANHSTNHSTMKTRILSAIVFVAALGGFLAGPLSAAPQKPASKAYSVQAVTRDGVTVVKVGSADSTVCRWLGEPGRKITDDVWAYFHFTGSREEAKEDGCSTLLLTIANGRVADIKLVNDGALRIIVAQMDVNPANGQKVFLAGK